ncbi:MAG: hypothetical protein RLZZ301_1742 [Bacteroidota bacterium]
MRIFILCVLFVISHQVLAQYTWGNTTLAYMNTVMGAKSSAVGGRLYTSTEKDLSLCIDQAALLDLKMNGQLHSSLGRLPNGVNYGIFSTVVNTKFGSLAPFIRYMNYGKFTETDANGNAIGEFSGLDYQVGASYAYSANPVLKLGIQLSLLGSSMERYSAFGLSSQWSALLIHPNQLFVASVGVRNLGLVFKDYTASSQSKLPLDVFAAASYKLAHAPFRFHAVAHSLNRSQNIYLDPNAKPTFDPLTGDTIAVYNPDLLSKLANHLQFQVELLASSSFQLRAGFDVNRRHQLAVSAQPGMAGFSMGCSFKVKKFNLDYGIQFYSKAGSIQSIGLSTSLERWKKHI